MKIFICLDDNCGMLFNNRRQSRDKLVLADIAESVEKSGGALYITPFSEKLLASAEMSFTVCENMLEIAGENDLCFVENLHIGKHLDRISEITVYRWNRVYPYDFSLDINIEKCGYHLKESCEFIGNAHEKITKETFAK